jgi:hypothetical protein
MATVILVSICFSLGISVCAVFRLQNNGEISILYPVICLTFIFNLVSIGLKFYLAYYDMGELITNRVKIAWNYLRRGFIWDFFSIVPLLLSVFYPVYHTRPPSIESLLVLIKLRDIYQFHGRFQGFLLSDEYKEAIFSLISLFGTILFINHFIACIWCLIPNSRLGAIYEKNWTSNLNITDSIEIYLKASYWSLTTIVTLGYGDILPQNIPETGFCMFVMIIGSAIFGYSVNKIGNVLENMQRDKRSLR